MLFNQSLRKELYATASAVFVTLLTVVLTVSLVRILGQAAAGRADPTAIVLLIALGSLNALPILLSLTAFMAVLLVVGRMYKDSEMNVWFASGVPLSRFLEPVLFFSLPFGLLIFIFSFFIAPWTNQQIDELRARYEQRDDISRISPGRFIESAGAERVFFVESFDQEKRTVTNVFAAFRETAEQQEKITVLVADRGRIEVRDGERYVVMLSGRRYEGSPGLAQASVMQFDTYALRLESQGVALASKSTDHSASALQQLIIDFSPNAQAELVKRLGGVLMLLNLAFLALPLSFANPRAGRSANLLLALLFYVIYNNLLSFSQAQVNAGKWSFIAGISVVHILVLALTWVLIMRTQSKSRLNPFSVRTWRIWARLT
jgi:lipopolysaccharide export system permease protein